MSIPRPNVLFVMTDDQTIREMSCYGSEILQTPNMDRIANGGTRFNYCFATNALCAPARATVLTGCYSHIHGIFGHLLIMSANGPICVLVREPLF